MMGLEFWDSLKRGESLSNYQINRVLIVRLIEMPHVKEQAEKFSGTDLIQSQISPKTSCGKKDSTK